MEFTDGPASMYPPPVGQQPLSMGPPYPPGPSPSKKIKQSC